MPWHLETRDGKYCVVKDGGGAVPGGCHASRADAIKHQRALYANESSLTSAIVAPLKPPRSFFEIPEPSRPTPMTYQEDGRVFGHLALWESCHRGFMGGSYTECVRPPRSATNYKQFHLGQIETQEGEKVAIGKITFDTDHAPLTADVVAASRHYDNTGSVGAYVRARDGRLGIWLSGSLRPDLPPEGLVSLRANPLSGDWRSLNHSLELVASLAVPVPGFPIPQSQLALAAAADGGLEVSALILPAFQEEVMAYTAEQKRRKKMLSDRALTAAVLTTERRNALPDSAFAMPGRHYPIHDEAHARNALARSAGKAEEMQVRRAVCKRYPNMGECKSK